MPSSSADAFVVHKKAIQIVVTLAILGFLFAKIGVHSLVGIMAQAANPYLFLATLFFVAQALFLSARWQCIVNDSEKYLHFNDALKVTAASNLANALLFTSLSGILVRIGMTMQKGIPAIKASYLSIADRMLTLLALLAIGVIFLPLAADYLPRHFTQMFIGLAATFAVCVPLGLWWALANISPVTIRRHRRFFCAISHLRRLFWRRRLNGALIIGNSLLGQFCFFVAVYFLIHANGGAVSMLPLLAIVPVISIISAFPVSIGGWGVREGAFVYGLQMLAVPADLALATSIEVGILTMLTAFILYLVTFGLGASRENLIRYQDDARKAA